MSLTRKKQAIITALEAVLLWSTVATAFKLTLRMVSPTDLVWWAALVSFFVLSTIVVWTKRLPLLRSYIQAHWKQALLMGTINPFVYYWALFGAYAILPAQEAQAINYTWALILMFLSVPMLGHRLSRWDILAGMLGYLGVYILATHGDIFGMHFTNLIGVGLALMSTIFWALYWMLSTRISEDTMVVQMTNFGVGVFMMGGYLLWRGMPLEVPTGYSILGVIYIGLFEMSITFILWGRALKLTKNTAVISNLIYLSPILSLVFIHFIVGEEILSSTIIALGLILAGLFLQHYRGKREEF